MPFVKRVKSAFSKRWRRLSLRARLSLGIVVVTAVGLVVADVIVYGQIESYLSGQVDSELQTTLNNVVDELNSGPFHQFQFSRTTPVGTYGAFITSSGTLESTPASQLVGPTPVLPSWVTKTPLTDTTRYFTTSARGNAAFHYRVLARSDTANVLGQPSVAGFLIVAIPIQSLDATLSRLLAIDLIVSAAVLALLALVGYAVVRVGMRPLGEIERTAGAIAAGDLSRRVERDDDRTEVGRLGRSLNEMLATIEHSFSEKQASEDRLRQFLADASHELRTPITSIRGYSELFRRGAASRPDDLASSLRRIEDEATRMGLLVDDLLLLARLDQGRPLDQQPVDVSEVAREVANEIRVVAPDRPVIATTPEPEIVIGDEQRLRQVVSNLVRNAVEHTPSGTAITISVSSRDGQARLVVHDDGPGIPEEYRERIFERFFRADPSRARDSGGAGLGLSIVASIAGAHRGRAYLDPDGGGGANFIVEIPLASIPEPQDVVVSPESGAPARVDDPSALLGEGDPISNRK